MKILFVCRGNVGRSQMAEAIFNKTVKDGSNSDSAGTLVFNKDGESRNGVMLKNTKGAEEVIKSMAEIDIDINENKRTQLTEMMLNEYDKVVVMAEIENVPEYVKEIDKIIYWEVEDPKGMSLEETSKIRDQIAGLVHSLILDLNMK